MSENKDPVCGMEVELGTAVPTREYYGETFYFCSAGCVKKLDADSGRYVMRAQPESHDRYESPSDVEHCHHPEIQDSKAEHRHCHGAEDHHVHSVAAAIALSRHNEAEAEPTSKGTYRCPMHPAVVSDKPRNCPKCGMTLELSVPKPAETKTIYTCPMHPEIERDHPGQCPKCGMTLEPAFSIPSSESC